VVERQEGRGWSGYRRGVSRRDACSEELETAGLVVEN